jgi:hypothetical protein
VEIAVPQELLGHCTVTVLEPDAVKYRPERVTVPDEVVAVSVPLRSDADTSMSRAVVKRLELVVDPAYRVATTANSWPTITLVLAVAPTERGWVSALTVMKLLTAVVRPLVLASSLKVPALLM